ncbi:MAG: PAS domain-containing sensor histidine kinase [Cytophagales bacterium]|nr:PAS domain-containing sensor histidine kinase [Cytophagales bacterium]
MEDRYSRIEHITQILFELAAGNFDVSCEPSKEGNEFDALLVGINMLREELRASTVSKNHLQGIYDGIVDLLIIVNRHTNIIEQVNSTVCSELKYDKSELVFNNFFDFIDMKKSKEAVDYILEELEKNNKVSGVELWFKNRKGRSIPTTCSASYIYNNERRADEILFTAKNIFEMKETERKLIDKNRELDIFVYKSSHDLKGPLSSIIGLANVAEMEITDNATALQYFQLIKESAERLQSILVDLSELARLRNSAHQIQTVDLKKMTEDILRQYLIDERLRIEIDFELYLDETPTFVSNGKIIRSIIQNLIDNAIKYRKISTETKPEIIISLELLADDSIVFTIKDNGLGIRSDKISEVFDMFLRATQNSKGTGLGLYIVKTSVQKLKGTIDVKSKEGEGSIFILTLPSLNDGDLQGEEDNY